MNDRHRQKPKHRSDTIPKYNRDKKHWRVRVDDRVEFGSLLYVCGEFANTGLYYPFWTSDNLIRQYEEHAHSFEGVLQALIRNPEKFSIKGDESYYSEQEIEMLEDVQNRLLSMKEEREDT